MNSDSYDSNVDWSFKNEKNYDSSQQQFWHQQFIKVDLRKLEVTNCKEKIEMDVNTYTKLSLVLRFISNELCISLNNATEEVVIPLDQVVRFRISQYKDINVEFRRNFERSYFRYQQGPLNQREQISFDPSRGKLDDAQTIAFTPAGWVDSNTLIFFGEGIKRLRFDRHRENTETRKSGLSSNILENEHNERGAAGISNERELYITCSFLTNTFALQVPDSITFKEILYDVQTRYKIEINPNRITYKNQVNDIITLIDEDDWQAAKWEAKRAKSYLICMYFS